jgi:hypothetical protein
MVEDHDCELIAGVLIDIRRVSEFEQGRDAGRIGATPTAE